jgi:hypothetical protein
VGDILNKLSNCSKNYYDKGEKLITISPSGLFLPPGKAKTSTNQHKNTSKYFTKIDFSIRLS